MGENRDVGWGCLCSSPAQVGAVPLGFAHLDTLGFWDLLTCLGLCPKSCIVLTWTLTDPGSAHLVGSAHLDPTDWGICSPGHCQTLDLLTWSGLCLQDLLTWMLPDPGITGAQIPQPSWCHPLIFL